MLEKILLAIYAVSLIFGLIYTKKLVDATSRNSMDSGSNIMRWK